MMILFNWVIFRFHVNFQGCNWLIWRITDVFFGGASGVSTVVGVFLAMNTSAVLNPKILRHVGWQVAMI